uniref:60S ribosomal protein L31 n=1 Tax=Lotharella oceanica TaxID=641309 RepID=A0A7S2TPK4_9EUKA
MEKDVDEMGGAGKNGKKHLDLEIPADSKIPREKDPKSFYARAKQKITQAELTFNIHRHTYKNWKKRQQWKRKTAETVRLIREYAKKMMHVDDVEITQQLNEVMWKHGRRHVPVKIRLRMVRCYQAAGFTGRGRPYPAREFVRVYYLHMDEFPRLYNHWMRGEQTIVTDSGRLTKGIQTDELFHSGK